MANPNVVHEAYRDFDAQLDVLCEAAEAGSLSRVIQARKAVYDSVLRLVEADRQNWLEIGGQKPKGG